MGREHHTRCPSHLYTETHNTKLKQKTDLILAVSCTFLKTSKQISSVQVKLWYLQCLLCPKQY